MVDRATVGVVDEEVAEEAVEDEDEADVQGEICHVAEAVLRPDPLPAPPDDGDITSKFLFRHCFNFRPISRST